MGKILTYALLAVVLSLALFAVYLFIRIFRLFRKARRLEMMRNYETILYAALSKLSSARTLETLLPDPDPGVLEDVLLRMGDEGAEGWKEKVIELYGLAGFTEKRLAQLRSRSGRRRADAARRLGRICDPSAVSALKELLEDGEEEVREAALFALGRIGTPDALRAMLEGLDHDDRWTQEKLAEVVEEAGDETRRILAELLRDPDPARRTFAAEVMGRVGGADEAALLERALGDEELDVRARAADSLGRLQSRPSRQALLRALEDPAWEVRAQAAKALGRIGEGEDAPRLAAALRDREWWVRNNAAAALREMGEAGEASLVEALWDGDRFARETAAQALEEGGQVERLVEQLEGGGAGAEAERVLLRLAELGCTGTMVQVLRGLPKGEAKARLSSMLSGVDKPELRETPAGAGAETAGAGGDRREKKGKGRPRHEGGSER